MSNAPTSQNRASLIKQAASLPKGSAERKALLAGLRTAGTTVRATVSYVANFGLLVQLPGSKVLRIDMDKIDFGELTQGKSVSALVELPTNEETPLYTQKELYAVQEELSSALNRLTAVTKRF